MPLRCCRSDWVIMMVPSDDTWVTGSENRAGDDGFESAGAVSVAEAGLVDVAVEPHPGQAAEDRSHQSRDDCGDQGDDAAGGQVARADGDAGEAVELAEDVVLAAEQRTDDGDHEGDDDRPHPQ